jgi:phosphomannomutase
MDVLALSAESTDSNTPVFMTYPASCFKAYDIRGTVPEQLTPAFAHALGLAFGAQARALGESAVAVGRDGRLSGPDLSQALCAGLADAGVDVIDVGMVTTPMLYFAAHTLCHSGIQITGSHNPKHYNGFKMVLAGQAIYGEQIIALRDAMNAAAQAPGLPAQQIRGHIRQQDVHDSYTARIVSDVRLARPMKVVVDSGNGVAGASAPGILRALGCEVVELFSEVDGNFPNHHPDPSKPENLQDLIAALRASDADVGLAFDGDGDRLGVVTTDGNNIYPDRQMVLFARDVLSRVPGGAIVFDVKCSQRLAPEIEAAGGTPVMYKTGHSLVKAHMKALNSPLGGEMSGHIFFKERWFGFDDGTYAAARLLEILSQSTDASAVLNDLPTSLSTPELNVDCSGMDAHALVQQLVVTAQADTVGFASPAQLCTIDGLRADWPDGFGLIRASNTTPVLVLRFEGHTDAALARIQALFMNLLRTLMPDAQVQQAAH